jgi:Zn-dependent M28 family amino/carboxypeptidase
MRTGRLSRLAVTTALLFVTAGWPPPAAAQSASVDSAQLFRDLDALSADSMEGRLAGTPGSAKAREYILGRFKAAKLTPADGKSFEQPFTFRGARGASDRPGVNLVAMVRGRREPGRFIVVTAHYDHLGVVKGQVFNGADDNASGVAAMLAVAARLAAEPPDHSIIFAALDAEELGLHGARAFVSAPPVAKNAMVVNVNLDMVGRDAKNLLFAAGTSHYPFLKPYLEKVAQPPVVLRFGHDVAGSKEDDWTRDSDHFPFHEAVIPFVYFGVEDEAQHHKATDDAETITREFFAGAANTILAALRRFDANLDKIAKRQ